MEKTFCMRWGIVQVVLMVVVLSFAQNVNAIVEESAGLGGFQDVESSSGNSISASSLDAEVASNETELQNPSVAEYMLAGNTVSRTGNIKNVGLSDFQYKVVFEKVSGNDEFCSGLQLEAKKGTEIAYAGNLSGFDFNVDVLNVGVQEDWDFNISLPSGYFVGSECVFDFKYIAWQTSFVDASQGWVDTEVITNNKIFAGIETPMQTGYNVNDESDINSYGVPRDPNEIACTGGATNINGVSVHWTDVSGENTLVKYQREYSKVDSYDWTGNEIYTEAFTNYRTFGGNPGAEAVYGSHVRAWFDENDNDVVDVEEMVSEWSNECFIEFDVTAPAMPTGLRRLERNDHNVVHECGDITNEKQMHPDWADNTEGDFDHYEYTSFNAPNGAVGLNEKIFYDSIFEYNGSWLPNDGTYGFAVRAVDKAGNKSDWALGGDKTFEDSCQITYDTTGPVVTIDAIKYLDGTIEPDKFVTSYNTPTIVGSISDDNGIQVVGLVTNGQGYLVTVTDDMWEVHITDVLPDGVHTLRLKAVDSLGNITEIERDIRIDTVAPYAEHTFYKDGVKIEGFNVYYDGGHKFSGPVVYIDNDLSRLSFTGEYTDTNPSAGLYWDSYAIFEAQDDGSFAFSQNGKRSLCSWRREPNLVDISDQNTFSLTDRESFDNCVASLPEGEYYIAHHIYDYATRDDIPTINQFRDVLGLHFIVDTAPSVPTDIRILDNEDNDLGCEGVTNNRYITVDWADSIESDVDHFDYQIREAITIAQPTVSEYSGRIRDEDGYYKYRVRAVDDRDNTSGWTPWCGVTLDRDAPEAPTLIEPTNESVVTGESLLSDWSDVSDAHHYIYESYHDSSTSHLRWHHIYQESEKTATDVDDAVFWWRVKAVDEAGNESDWSELWKVTIDNTQGIVLNEFMPKPVRRLEDQWVEIYNNGDETVDVNGWYITDAKGPNEHKRKIDVAHTDTGSTKIAPGEFLVIKNYGTFHLNDEGDTIKLFNDRDILIDSYKYKKSEVRLGKTIARIPDGVGDWADPVPTPGEKNNPSNDKKDFFEYYKNKCFDGENVLCEKDFMKKYGISKKEEKKKEEKKQKDMSVVVEKEDDKKVDNDKTVKKEKNKSTKEDESKQDNQKEEEKTSKQEDDKTDNSNQKESDEEVKEDIDEEMGELKAA
jgi:hypothetical protein